MGKMKQTAEARRKETEQILEKVENVSETVVEVLRSPELAEHHEEAVAKLAGFTIAKAALNARLTMLDGWRKL